MKTLGGIGAMILGVIAILVSFGLQTIWAPPAVFNATTHTTQEAPLTIITDGVDVDPDDAIEYTITADGEFTLMYGQLRDIEAWVGDAAHHRIDGVETDVARGDAPTVNIDYIDGEADLPNPVNSDLWLATQEVTDEVTQRWTRVDEGEWALLVAVDGTAPAPTNFSVSWVNVEPNSPWIVPLFIAGSVLIAIGIALLIWRFVEFRRRAKRTSGRRAIQRGDYTGLTAADVMADSETTTQTLTVEHINTGTPVANPDDQQTTQVVAGAARTDKPTGPTPDERPGEQAAEDVDRNNDHDADDPSDDDNTPGSETPASEDPSEPRQDPADEDPHDHPKDSGFLRRIISALSALGLATGVGIGPAHATTPSPEPTSEEDLNEQVDGGQLEDADSETPETFPVVVDQQLDQILQKVSGAVAAGDEALDEEELTIRVAGHALRVRQDGYRNNTIDDAYPNRATIHTAEVLATWMDRDDAFPRTIYTVTADANEENIQLLVLRQHDPRSQYQLIHNAPLAPGTELPTGDLTDHDVTDLAVDTADNLVMSPAEAVDALANYLSDPDAAEDIADNEWIELIHEHQADQEQSHAENDVDFSVSRSAFDDSITAARLPNDSALVFGTMNSLESLTPEEDGATVDLDPLTQEIGEFSSASQEDTVRIRYREQFALLVPPDGEVSLAGYETVQSTVE